ncbi:Uncharacterised protein [Klebsiella aerogenes]|nr:Uncharacterised protein [Klebsiella aerogenes]
MEERKSYGMVVLFVSVFVVFLVSIMSYSLWRDRQVNAFMTTNRAWGIQCDTVSQGRVGGQGRGAGGPSDKSSASVLQRLPL